MDTIAISLVPQLVRELYECSITEDVQNNNQSIWKSPTYDFHAPFCLPDITDHDTTANMDKMLGLVSTTCEYAARALSSYTGPMLAALRSRRNLRLPIYRLSSEILANIFLFAVERSSNRARPLAKRAPFNVSHVSSRWREVATTTPRLWAQYDATNARLAHIILGRSQSAPLHIELAPYDSECFSDDEDPEEPHSRFPILLDHATKAHKEGANNFSKFIGPLLPHVSRWEEVIFKGVTCSLWEHLRFPAPNLKRLEVATAEDDTDAPSIQFFGGSTPLLRDLRLWVYGPPLTSPIYTGLTTLRLDNIPYENTVRDLLGALAGCPCLRRLILKDLGFDPPGDPPPPHIDIHLPQLEEVKFNSLGEDVAPDIISSITASPTVRFKVVEEEDTWDDDLLGMIFRSNFFPSSVPPIRWVHCKLLRTPFHVAFDAGDFEHGCRMEVEFRRRSAVIPGLARHLPIQSLESLALENVDSALNPASFTALLANLPSITSITLSECSWRLVNVLIATPDSNLCPLLRELRLQKVDVLKKSLLELARSRTASSQPTPGGVHLSRLVFSNCAGLDLSTVLELRSLSLHVRVLPRDSQLEEIRFSRVQS
ncbi:hypothetical protein BOTBODRAFT_176815 [Botryobasidium botryosum FD-172 SS1]|uniref:Uncharacterized protein n=1 Tax=Botryobasidium botryosum (strain FD-172 SS1) TaxID=930990 RepID=A0A067MBH8_BOTB1|nr:hypothetical protein BOTBODRAFT_176815 [Botryobasidium botryosum FD-172 SS1]